MCASKKKKGLFDMVWDWLCSLKVNVIILISLAVTSIFGTIIPQGKDPDIYIKFAGPKWYEFFKATQLDDMYHSYWFVALLGLLCVTITVCSIDKFPSVWRFFVKPKKDLDDNQVKYIDLKETLTLKTSMQDATDLYSTFLTKNIADVTHTEIDGKQHLFAQSGLWTRFGVYITHLSLIIIIVGALVGVFWGEKGYIQIGEFTTVNSYYSQNIDDMKELDFYLRLNGYETTYYDNSMQPKAFISDITVIDNGREVKRQLVKVNNTLQYKGYTFYQSSYGAAGNDSFYMILDVIKKSDGTKAISNGLVYSNEATLIPGTADKVTLVSYKDDKQWGPMAGLKVTKPDGTSKSFWAYPKFQGEEDKREGDYKFLVSKVKELQYTGMQVANDPGVWTVYIGCGLMIIGTLIAFFMSHKRFWVRIENDGGSNKTKVTFAASTNKNKETFEREFNIIKEKFVKFEA